MANITYSNQAYPTAIGDKTYPWAMHTAWGVSGSQPLWNVIETTGAYTYHKKIVSAATAGAVLGSTAGNSTLLTITSNITNPDVPRVLAVTVGGSGEGTGNVLINGVNVEGKPITDTIAYTTTGQVVGSLVFKRVYSVVIPAAAGSSATFTVDTTNKIGLNHRGVPSKTTIVCLSATLTSPLTEGTTDYKTNLPTIEAAVSSSNVDNEFVEKNWAQPATAPNGTTFLYFFYWFYEVLIRPPKDSPEFYSTTTSTSTSSTSSSTSISSTSSSISTTTSLSTSSSTSISSTSTSTTTLPF